MLDLDLEFEERGVGCVVLLSSSVFVGVYDIDEGTKAILEIIITPEAE